jgi:arsenite-transporting ATPase
MDSNLTYNTADQNNPMGGMMQDLAYAIPGVDEAMGFAEVMKQVKTMSYSVVVFDTAPTGHTLRFLSFPTVLEKALAKISGLSSRFGPMVQQVSGMMGMNANQEDMFSKLEEMRSVITEVNNQFKDPVGILNMGLMLDLINKNSLTEHHHLRLRLYF